MMLLGARLFLQSTLRACLLLSAIGFAASSARAADIEGSSDHPLVGRYEGAEIVGYDVAAYDETIIVDGPMDPGGAERAGPGFRKIEGKIVLIYYRLPKGRSTLEVLRNYEASLKEKGFSILFTCATSNGTCFTSKRPDGGYLLGIAVGDPLALPRLLDDYVHNWFQRGGRYLLARLERAEGAVYAGLYLGESDSGNVAVVRVVESKEMETKKIAFVTASEMEAALRDKGKIELYSILFDFDKDTIKPESQPTLAEIAALLKSKPELRLKVIGHTDNQGTANYNLDLSRRRAANVVAALSRDFGISPERLSAEGAGFSQPIATNDTEEGRAKNRRVELVAQ
jgi:OOP family OmpA-OmpF porin